MSRNDVVTIGSACEIILTDRHGAEKARAVIDRFDLHKLEGLLCGLMSNGYVRVSTDDAHCRLYLHRFLLGLPPRSPKVDHINRNPLDNRRSNLRVLTQSDNTQNRGTVSLNRSKSGFRGSHYDKRGSGGKHWFSRVTVGNKQFIGRYYHTPEAAAAAAQALRREHMPYSAESHRLFYFDGTLYKVSEKKLRRIRSRL